MNSRWYNRVRLYTGSKYDPCMKIKGFIRFHEDDETIKVALKNVADSTVDFLMKTAGVYIVLDRPDGTHCHFGWCIPEAFLYGAAGDLQVITFHKIRIK